MAQELAFKLLIALPLTLMGGRAGELSLDDVLRRHSEATGGRKAIEQVGSLEIDLHIVGQGFEVDGLYRADRQGRMRIDVLSGGKRVYTEAYDGREAWQQGERDVAAEAPGSAGAAALRHGIEWNLFGLHELAARGHQLELLPRQKLDGVEYYVVRVVLNDGFTSERFLDPSSWLVTRVRESRALHPDVDPKPVTLETRISDFRRVAGALRGFRSEQREADSDKPMETVTLKEVRVNSNFEAALFQRPAPGKTSEP
jgi:hypothetical protein